MKLKVLCLLLFLFCNFYHGIAMDQRISIITLGVKDLKLSKKFYDDLGWQSALSDEHLVAYQLKDLVFCLFPEKLLAEDASSSLAGAGFKGITLAYNVASKEEVDRVLKEAKEVGANIVRKASEAPWGGYRGYFADPDGHLWEVAWNPYWPISKDGKIILPKR